MRGRAEAARRAHNPEVIGSNPIPATFFACFTSKWIGKQAFFYGFHNFDIFITPVYEVLVFNTHFQTT